MSHRRAFLAQLATLAGAAGVGRLLEADRLLAASLERASAIGTDAAAAGGLVEPRQATHGSGATSFRQLREEYLLGPDVVYLNHASIGTIPKAVQQAHKSYLDICETNPWLYVWGDAWEEPREEVRRKAAALLGCGADEIALTHNTTEGFNLLASGLELGTGDEVLFSSLNHPGASVCWYHQARSRGFGVRQFAFPLLDVPSLSTADVVELYARAIRPETRVLVFPHVDNAVGLRHPVKELAAAARARGVEFVAVDGAQTVGMLPVDLGRSGVDFYAASPHKWLQAPKGLGLLYVRAAVRGRLSPMWVTWGQERWAGTVRIFEDYGTRNLPELLALGDAIDFQGAISGELRRNGLSERRQLLKDGVEGAPGLAWGSPASWELGASLAAIELQSVASRDFFRQANRDRGLVFRPFDSLGLNTVRISPNLITTEGEIELFLETAAAAAARGR